ncbi:protein kinase [Streptosporangium sp. NPDC002524]|uniref:serine/threonine protein kinase n=1 Tax=Streptosporangium sp. NPDC002524 TaxID=3154537 RepID=UPI0033256459
MESDRHDPPPGREADTRGGPDLPTSASGTDVTGGARARPAVPADEPNGLFVGPADAPDRYELLGDGIPGGQGVTWKARYHGDLTSPLPLAVKLLHPPHDAGPDWPSSRDRQRWRDHAVLLRHLRLDHVVRLDEVFLGAAPHPYDSPPPEATAVTTTMAYLVMEWVEGATLQDLLAGDRARDDTVRDRLLHVVQAGEALAGLASMTRSGGNPSLHRDLKPSNCIVHARRGLVLIDVSTLRLVDDGYDFTGWHTPPYTAPEVLAAPHLPRTVAADVYSLGALAFFCLTGQDPPAADVPDGAAYIELELRAVAGEAGVGDRDRLTSHVLTALNVDASRRPADLRRWSRGLLEAAHPAAGGSEQAPPAGVGGAKERSRPRRLAAAIAALAVTGTASALLLSGFPARTTGPSASYAAPTTATPTPSGLAATTGDAADAAGTITSPTDRSAVKHCSYFTGTARLRPSTTLILAMQNLDNGDPAKYIQFVHGFERPGSLSTWRGAQFFGGPRTGVGQRYRVELMAVSLASARRVHASGSEVDEALVKSATSLASVRVRRIDGMGPNGCVGPPDG